MLNEGKSSAHEYTFIISKNKVRAALPFSSKDKNRPILGLLHFEHKGGRSILTTTDSYRAVAIDFTKDEEGFYREDAKDFELFIPALVVKQLVTGSKNGYLRLDFDASNIIVYTIDSTAKSGQACRMLISTPYSEKSSTDPNVPYLTTVCSQSVIINQWTNTKYPDLERLLVKDPEKISDQMSRPAMMNPAYEIDACKMLQSLQKDEPYLFGAWRHFNDNQNLFIIFETGYRARSEKDSDGTVRNFPAEPNRVVAEALVMGLTFPRDAPSEVPESIYGTFEDRLCPEAREARRTRKEETAR